jgi:hypothetical protein
VLVPRLAKLAAASAFLRNVALAKQAASGLLAAAWKHKGTLAGVGVMGYGAKGQAQQDYQGFKPSNHQAQLGEIPVPPTPQG